jgi:hypothetical protein
MAQMSQREWLTQWFAQQFPATNAAAIADIMTRYYALNFIRKPEFMGFNGYNDGIKRTDFNPLAWWGEMDAEGFVVPKSVRVPHSRTHSFASQNQERSLAWSLLSAQKSLIEKTFPPNDAPALFELFDYPIEASAAQSDELLAADLTYLDTHDHDDKALAADSSRAREAYDDIQTLTAKYNSLESGKWDGMMSDHPRDRHVFEMPKLATAADANTLLLASWGAGSAACAGNPTSMPAYNPTAFIEQHCTISINAAHFARKSDTSTNSAKVGRIDPAAAKWNILADLGISGDSVVYGRPGLLADLDLPWLASGQNPEPTAWLEYDFTTMTSDQPATLALHLLPTFAVDSDHRLRYAVATDGGVPVEMDLTPSATAGKAAGAGDGPSDSGWAENVLRNSAVAKIPLGTLAPGKHTLRLSYRDPGVVFEHIVVTFPAAPPAYPVPPETR